MSGEEKRSVCYEIQYTKAADKFLKTHEDVRTQYEDAIRELMVGDHPEKVDVKRIRGKHNDYFRIRRSGTVSFDKIPVDASSKMPDAHMDAIEPYDYSELKPFSNAYLPGFLADKYDVEPEACFQRADERAEATTGDLMDRTVSGYSSCMPERRQIRIRRGRVSYALLPVWLLATRWNGQNYLFAMNGQTGKLIGDLPVSKGRALAWFAGIAAPLAAILAMLLY